MAANDDDLIRRFATLEFCNDVARDFRLKGGRSGHGKVDFGPFGELGGVLLMSLEGSVQELGVFNRDGRGWDLGRDGHACVGGLEGEGTDGANEDGDGAILLGPDGAVGSEDDVGRVGFKGFVVEDDPALDMTRLTEFVELLFGRNDDDFGLETVLGIGSGGTEAKSEHVKLDGSAGRGEEVERFLVALPVIDDDILGRDGETIGLEFFYDPVDGLANRSRNR